VAALSLGLVLVGYRSIQAAEKVLETDLVAGGAPKDLTFVL